MNSKLQNILFTVISAVLFGISMPSFVFDKGNFITLAIGFVSLIPYYISLSRACSNYKEFLLQMELYSLITNFINYYWLSKFMDYAYLTLGSAIFGYAIYYLILSLPTYWIFNNLRYNIRPLAFALIYSIYEYLKSLGDLGYPWNLAGYVLYRNIELVQIVDITGVWFLSFFIYFFQFTVAQLYILFNNKKYKIKDIYSLNILVLIVLFSTIYIYGLVRLNDFKDENSPNWGNKVSFLLIQQNLDPWEDGGDESLQTAMDITKTAFSQGKRADITVWSETTLPYYYNDLYIEGYYKFYPTQENSFIKFLQDNNFYLFTGVPYIDEENKKYNASIFLDKDANVLDWYPKQHLVPGGEKALLYDELPMVRWLFSQLGFGKGWDNGKKDTIFEYKDLKFSNLICFEDSFFDLGRKFTLLGSDFILNTTNNSWSKTKYAQEQHFVSAMFRAVENRRPLIRSTNSGTTSVVLPSGKILKELEMFKRDYLYADVYIKKNAPLTFYTVHGDYIVLIFALILLSIIIKTKFKKS